MGSPSGKGGEVHGPSHLGPSGGRGPRTWRGDVGLQAASGDACPLAASWGRHLAGGEQEWRRHLLRLTSVHSNMVILN